MISRLRRINREQRKLLFSLGTNFATRIPGLIGVLWFLPLLRFALGTDEYASLLAAMALGSVAAFLCGGFSIIGRRLIGDAYASGNRVGEADGFVSVVVANLFAFGLALAIIAAYCWTRGSSLDILVVAILPALSIFLTTFDNIRSAYNEQYVTALLQLLFQTTIYTIGFMVPATRDHLILAVLVLQGHMILASLTTLILLLRDRRYLLSGSASGAWRVVREGTLVATADGILMTMVSLAVVWLQASSDAAVSAWFATTVRLFQSFLIPVILLLIPLSSYIRLLWNSKSVAQQQALTRATLWIGLGYGTIVSFALYAASRLYVGDLLHLPQPGNWLHILPCFVLFGAIIAWKSYASIAFVVLDGSSHLSVWTTVAIGGSVLLGAAAALVAGPLSVVNVYALAAGGSIIVVLFRNAGRSTRPLSKLAVTGMAVGLFCCFSGFRASADDTPMSPIPAGYKMVWSDGFTALSLRSGGPTYEGLEHGAGTWAAPGAWYSHDPRGVAGYGGYDWFIDPLYYGWPSGYHGQLVITGDGLRIRAQPPLPEISALLPTVNGKDWAAEPSVRHGSVAPWLAGQVNSFHGVRIKAPFYFEARAKMPVGAGRPFAAIWLNTEARQMNDFGRNYEIDVQEGFGDSNRLHAGVHWDASPTGHDYRVQKVADLSAGRDLSTDFNTWGCDVTSDRQVFFFNGVEIGRVSTPKNAKADQPYGIILDVGAGLPWRGGGSPSGGPHDMIVRYVRLYAADSSGLTLRSP